MTTPTPRLVRALLGPTGPQIGCDECFEQLDVYVDGEIEGCDPEATVPGMRTHLAGCPACHEEYESLHALVTTSKGDGLDA